MLRCVKISYANYFIDFKVMSTKVLKLAKLLYILYKILCLLLLLVVLK